MGRSCVLTSQPSRFNAGLAKNLRKKSPRKPKKRLQRTHNMHIISPWGAHCQPQNTVTVRQTATAIGEHHGRNREDSP